jgi:predicted phosphodiesterase
VRYLILSDIHANREALEAVLRDAAGGFDHLVCCGDLVGYCADPRWVLEWARETQCSIVRGNHDKACAGLEDLEWFNPAAKASALWTFANLDEDNREFLAALPKGPARIDRFSVIHGSPLDEDDYLLLARDVVDVAAYLESSLTFFGHTHIQGGFLVDANGILPVRPMSRAQRMSRLELDPETIYLINPGSVGQPRDGDPRAAYAIYAPEDRLVEFHRIEYNIARAQRKIRDAGLPQSLADRLARGA